MTDYTRGTGNAGTLLIRDGGTYVEYWIGCSDPYTFTGGLSWSATGTGGGTVALSSGFSWRLLGSALISSSQNVTLSIGASGTSGIGGPTSFTQYIARSGGGGGGGGGATVPSAPNMPVASQVTTNSMRITWNIPANGGASIDQMLLRYADHTNPTLASGVGTGRVDVPLSGTTTTTVLSSLLTNETYYFGVYAHNSIGYSSRSPIASQTTLPPTPPGLTITPAVSGLQVTVNLTPPSGVTGVTSYRVESRPTLAGTPTLIYNNPTSPFIIAGLTPGMSYEYRASAFIGTYQSPWTSWTAVIQPNPNTNAGDYFDGSTAAGADVTYSWSGTANNSTSIGTGKNVTGWRTFAQGNSTSGGSGTVSRVTGGYVGAFAARVNFTQDTTAAGFIGGVDVSGAATVQPLTTYFGSLYVRLPKRTQRLDGGIAWFTSANALISITWGDDVVVTPSSTTWTRLTASGISPSNAAKAAPVVRDVTGTSWSLWLGGDEMWMDAAMVTLGQLVPYFDGDTATTENFLYGWEATANASASTRTPLEVAETDPLSDPDCPPVPLPPTPPLIPSDCIVEVGTWRRYTVAIPAGEVAQWSSTLPSLILSTSSQAERQVRIRVYPNPNGDAPELVDTTVWDAELILTYIPPFTEMTLDSVTQRVRASVNGGEARVANQLLYGTNGVPASWPELRCGIGYVITLDVPLDAPAGNLTTRVVLTSRV